MKIAERGPEVNGLAKEKPAREEPELDGDSAGDAGDVEWAPAPSCFVAEAEGICDVVVTFVSAPVHIEEVRDLVVELEQPTQLAPTPDVFDFVFVGVECHLIDKRLDAGGKRGGKRSLRILEHVVEQEGEGAFVADVGRKRGFSEECGGAPDRVDGVRRMSVPLAEALAGFVCELIVGADREVDEAREAGGVKGCVFVHCVFSGVRGKRSRRDQCSMGPLVIQRSR